MKNNRVCEMKPRPNARPLFFLPLAFAAGLLASTASASAQLKEVGDIADDFEVPRLGGGEPIRLGDHAGSVIVLDFFFYW